MLHQQHRGGTSYTHIAHYEPVLTSTSKEGASLGTRPLHGKEILVKLAYIKILNTAEFRWDESDWLIAIVSTFPTVLCCCFFFHHKCIYVSNMANWSDIEIETWLSPGLDTLQRIQMLYTLTTTWGGHQIHRQVGPKLWHVFPICNLSPSHGLPMVFLVLLDAHWVL